VNWIAARALKVALALTAVVGFTALAVSGARNVLLDVYLLGMGAVLLLAFVRTTREAGPSGDKSDFDRALAELARRPPESGELALVNDVKQSTVSSFHLHVRLRPVLREIAAHRLWMRFGVELDRQPAQARELMGTAAWELVRPDRPFPVDRLAAGPRPADLRTVVEELERI
jgi:hypothetical protein